MLAKGCLGEGDKCDTETELMVKGLCTGYANVMSVPLFKKTFHYRDFIYLMRHLNRTCRPGENGGALMVSEMALLRALEYNFNGIARDDFHELLKLFFLGITMENEAVDFVFPKPQDLRTPLAVLRGALEEAKRVRHADRGYNELPVSPHPLDYSLVNPNSEGHLQS